MIKICSKCGKEDEHHAKGMCFNCYRKFVWKPKEVICKRCGRKMPSHAKNLCEGCYSFVFHIDKTKATNKRIRYSIDIETYKEITKECVICGFNKIVDLHHLDENNKNSSKENLVGLCPNHHKMFHDLRYRKEVAQQLKDKGFNFKEDPKWDFKL